MSRAPACFRWYWFSQTASFVGDRLTGFTAPSIAILVLHASSAEVGLLSATGWLAYPVFGMLAGGFLAHVRKRPVLVAGELTRLLAFVAVGAFATMGHISVAGLVVAVAVAGVATVFGDVAGQTYLPTLVEPRSLFAANARLQSSNSLSKLVGPALAGLLIDVVGPLAALAVNALPFALSAFGQSRVATVEPLPRPERRDPVLTRIRDGLDQVRRIPTLWRIVQGSALRAFGIGIVDTVLLLFAYRALGLSSVGGEIKMAAGSLATLAGAFLTPRLAARFGVRRSTIKIPGSKAPPGWQKPLGLWVTPVAVVAAIRVLSSFWLPVWAVLTTGVRQSLAPAGHESAVHATVSTIVSSAVPAGSLAGGLVAGAATGWLGVTDGLALVLAAGGLLAAAGVLFVRHPDRNLAPPELVAA
ncbi:MFS transporter [Kutzneria sp. 744]|uniref:MFS transporter n=1 Tax=Kutzneria sp. (strain 744) TaxID=345341 RepID=UPI0003EEAEAD|nr:MFS transporter [Kutzneria sp. 744]EWM13470.1 export protein [Kutzneria sp. 744]